MQSVSRILLLLIYLSALTGWSANVHYCGSEVSSISLTFSHDENCCCSKIKCDCCSEKKISTKTHQDHITELQVEIGHKVPAKMLGELVYELPGFSSITVLSNSQIAHAPPPFKVNQPVYLRNRVLLI